ncbi:PTS sugar transporter subunit IIA [Actinocrispum wychmicini]|uniref:Glucose-specific phosphotransferase system IIA component n=1 Tax=Actinocrispum wychmicini TaxID=1213861 RepID=A0A4R2IZL0_9PSEU|nr:PTS glucose transporter subunit IIA [Actinocrispum wychmicini]TCO49868.1 glucose-specific phosphotransferase system IIA component [Actinocrispum wychmicini]
MSLRVSSPVSGEVAGLSAVPDPVFSQAMVGPGLAVRPAMTAGDVLAPVDGVVAALHPHAFVVAHDDQAVLVHLGIDTVKLKGEGFTLHVVKGESVRAGQPVVGWDPRAVEAAGYSSICPVVALDAQNSALVDFAPDGPVTAGDRLFVWNT